jgi:drug/metabolite transporter (DMT)-like permease
MKFLTQWASNLFGGAGTTRGMALMMLATFTGTSMNGVIRLLSADLHPFEVAFFRGLFGFLVFAPLFARHGLAPLRTTRPGMHVLRGSLQAIGMTLGFLALSMTPLAKVAALQFTVPLFGTVLALLILREVVRARRITALVIGILGTLIIVDPTTNAMDLGSVLVLCSAATSALSMIIVKLLSRTENSTTIVLYSTMLMTPLILIPALPYWETPTIQQLLWLALLGSLGTISNICFAQALKESEVTALTPIEFTRLIWSALIGYFAFAEVPAVETWIGAVIIFSASTYIILRERHLRKAAIGAEPPRP